MRFKFRAAGLAGVMLAATFTQLTSTATAGPTPVADNEAEYLAYGRVFPDPHGCLNQPPAPAPPGVSPFAKGKVCATQFLDYEETVAGASFLEQRFPRYMKVIRLDEAYDNPNYRSAGLPASAAQDEDGKLQINGRQRVPLYLFKVTDAQSPISEADRLHFAYGLSIHGIERAGLEGGVRAMEDLVTWAACENGNADTAPACNPALPDFEGPFPKKIVEAPTTKPVPTAGETLRNSVSYFLLANPDGWRRGALSGGQPHFQRYNGNGVDMNRDWPTVGYTYRPYSPASEPEVRAFTEVLSGIRETTSGNRFAGGIDLHGQLTASAFSYTLIGAGQRDYRKNFSTVDQSLRAWEDQTARLAWSPYIGTAVAPVADQWGTVIDTIAYQITGGMGDWFDSPMGLDAVGIDNEMTLSHLAPATVYEPILEQMHIDGNKGLIFSQLASMLTEQDSDYDFQPSGRVGYVLNPKRLQVEASKRPQNPGFPAQNDIDAYLPCAASTCGGGTFVMSGTVPTLEFDVQGPDRGVFNGGIRVEATHPNAQGLSAGTASRLYLDYFDQESGGTWQTVSTSYLQAGSPDLYAQAGQIVTANDPVPGRWRVRLANAASPTTRIEIDFSPFEAERSDGQALIDASPMDFFTDMNEYIPGTEQDLQPVSVRQVIDDPTSLAQFDSLVIANEALPAYANAAGDPLHLSQTEQRAYFANLRAFAEGGGNLVLTDGALSALESMGITSPGSVGSSQPTGRGAAPRFQFSVSGRGNLCTPDSPEPLLKDVCLPGTAGGTLRQVIEPAPLGYTPDATLDGAEEAKLTQYAVNRSAWEAGCGKTKPVECTSGTLGGAALGERHAGSGVIRISGALLPDPNYEPGGPRDMRFGVGSYALTFSAWQIFLNLIDYQRPS